MAEQVGNWRPDPGAAARDFDGRDRTARRATLVLCPACQPLSAPTISSSPAATPAWTSQTRPKFYLSEPPGVLTEEALSAVDLRQFCQPGVGLALAPPEPSENTRFPHVKELVMKAKVVETCRRDNGAGMREVHHGR